MREGGEGGGGGGGGGGRMGEGEREGGEAREEGGTGADPAATQQRPSSSTERSAWTSFSLPTHSFLACLIRECHGSRRVQPYLPWGCISIRAFNSKISLLLLEWTESEIFLPSLLRMHTCME